MSEKVVKFSSFEEQIKRFATEIVERRVGSEKYQAKLSESWCIAIGQELINKVRDMVSDYKVVVSVTIAQKAGGLVQSTTWYHDAERDGCITAEWKNPHMDVMIACYGLAFD